MQLQPAAPTGAPGTPCNPAAASTDREPPTPARWRRHYLATLTWAFTLFNSVRVLTYLPTIWAIQASGNSDQHSLWTWGAWFGANATMALWLYENNHQRVNRAVAVNIGNAAMCLATLLVIAAHRL